MQNSNLIFLARSAALKHQLYDYIICGICERESSWNPWAIRYEPAFQEHYVAKLNLPPTESVARSTSWGLMQTLGESVYEIGYRGDFPALCDPATGIEWGCQLFAKKLSQAGGDYARALLLWNGGGNPSYGPDVLALSAKYGGPSSAGADTAVA
jgi:soluble lytic murein transglycosylase-like protein